MDDEPVYSALLKSIAAEGIQFRAIGTFALKLLISEYMKDYVLKDADIVLEPLEGNLRAFVASMRIKGWKVAVWGDEVEKDVQMEFLKNKFYLRCTLDSLILDATYECPIPFEKLSASNESINAIPLAGIPEILELKRRKGNKEDSEMIIQIEKWSRLS